MRIVLRKLWSLIMFRFISVNVKVLYINISSFHTLLLLLFLSRFRQYPFPPSHTGYGWLLMRIALDREMELLLRANETASCMRIMAPAHAHRCSGGGHFVDVH